MKNHIFFLRRKDNIKQQDMASVLGISPSYLSKLESGSKEPTEKIKFACADFLKVNVNDLFNDDATELVFPDFSKDLKCKVWVIRMKRGITQKELAEKLNISMSYLSKVEFGHTDPSKSFKKKCASELDLPVEMLFKC